MSVRRRRAFNTDKNQRPIVAALRKAGCTVVSLNRVGLGCPDILVAYRGLNYLVEIKQEKENPTTAQAEWHRRWAAPVLVFRSVDDVVDWLKHLGKEGR